MKLVPPLRILSAGSLRAALTAHVGTNGTEVEIQFGPAGLLRQQIEEGDPCDLYLSANLAHPTRLAAQRLGTDVVPFARNSLVGIARRDVGLRTDNFLDILLDPKIRIGTSTPGADPGGDYAQALFRRAGEMRAGADAILIAKAQHLVGGTTTPDTPAGQHPMRHFLETRVIDVSIRYATTPRAMLTDFDVVVPPDTLQVVAEYGLIILATQPERRAEAAALVKGLLSPAGFAPFLQYGFAPVS